MYHFLYLEKKRARKAGIKINNFKNLKSTSHLIFESPVSLGDTNVYSKRTLHIGRHTYMRSGEIHDISRIGRYCSFGQNVILGLYRRSHPLDWVSTSSAVYEAHTPPPMMVDIGHDVWIGQGAVIMSGVRIGNGAVIGCNAVVIKDVDPYQIVAGNPAKPVRYRFEKEIITALNESEWWEYPLDDLKQCHPDNVQDFILNIKKLNKRANNTIIKIINRRVCQ